MRGVEVTTREIETPIVTHIGRAVTEDQAQERGKWSFYRGFHKALELYHLDRVLTDEMAMAQTCTRGRIILVEGCMDVARLVQSGQENCLASFGATLSEAQLSRLELLRQTLGISEVLLFFDRDDAGQKATETVRGMLRAANWQVQAFDWSAPLGQRQGHPIVIPDALTDPAELSEAQIQWLAENNRI